MNARYLNLSVSHGGAKCDDGATAGGKALRLNR